MSLLNKLKEKFGQTEPLRERLAGLINKKNDSFFSKETPVTETPEIEVDTPQKLTSKDIKFQESQPGFRGMPYIKKDGDSKFLDEYDFKPTPPTQRITRLEITDPRDATQPDTNQQGVVIDDPKALEVFNTIKSVADEIAPEYTDYLLRLAWYEGRGQANNRLDNGDRGMDRGIFQINDKAFPDVPDEFADDPVKATMWAISLIEEGKQSRWVADKYVRKAKTKIDFE